MSVQTDLQKLADPKRAEGSSRYFKTGKGEYGEGDTFIGLTLVAVRETAKKYENLPLADIEKLLANNIHEFRTTALVILKLQWRKADEAGRKKLFAFYLKNRKHINNWDLVDISAPEIVGGYLLDKPKERKLLYTFAKSKNLWERRIAILSTFAFIKKNDFKDSFAIAELLLKDKEDLIHKAVGWMLREVGKKDEAALVTFLAKHYKTMPRTMLRYAIEKFSEERRKKYLLGNI